MLAFIDSCIVNFNLVVSRILRIWLLLDGRNRLVEVLLDVRSLIICDNVRFTGYMLIAAQFAITVLHLLPLWRVLGWKRALTPKLIHWLWVHSQSLVSLVSRSDSHFCTTLPIIVLLDVAGLGCLVIGRSDHAPLLIDISLCARFTIRKFVLRSGLSQGRAPKKTLFCIACHTYLFLARLSGILSFHDIVATFIGLFLPYIICPTFVIGWTPFYECLKSTKSAYVWKLSIVPRNWLDKRS